MKIGIISPNCSETSASRLADLLGGKYLHADYMDYRSFDVVINYGSSNQGLFRHVINTPESVKLCVNKISTLKRVVHGVEWTKNPEVALSWFEEGDWVVARATEIGSRSEGAIICVNKDIWNESPAKFWTRYFPHEHEVRINVFKGKILSIYEKVVEGDVFTFNHLPVVGENHQVTDMILSIKNSIGIDMYGMDVLVNKHGECRLLEVNSGAVLQEETEPVLVEAILKEIKKYE